MGSRNRTPVASTPILRDDPDDGSREELAEYYASLCSRCVRHNRDCPIDVTTTITQCVEYSAPESKR
jgi:hypothetical protein